MALIEYCGYCGHEKTETDIIDPEYDIHVECVRDWLCIDEDEEIENGK